MTESAVPQSPNFAFLTPHGGLLVRYAAQAERYVFSDPNAAVLKLRQFGEVLVEQTAAKSGQFKSSEANTKTKKTRRTRKKTTTKSP